MESSVICAVVTFLSFTGNLPLASALTLLSGERVFALHPRHVWHGGVRAKQIGEGELTLCADSNAWNLPRAHQVCKDLGFQHGAMLFGSSRATFEADESASCVFIDEEGVYCNKHQQRCSSSAWVSCQFPGFMGCFPFSDIWVSVLGYQLVPEDNDIEGLTIEMCIARCRAFYLFYAGIENGSHCYCGMNDPVVPHADRSSCPTPCGGDSRQGCGGSAHIAVYDVNLGKCNGTFDIASGGRSSFYLSSPGFPGYYNTPTQCQWMFNMPAFDFAVMSILGLDLSSAETLRVITSEAFTGHKTSDETLVPTREPFVERGNWSLELMEHRRSGSVGLIFNASQHSDGDRQFLIAITVNQAMIFTDSRHSNGDTQFSIAITVTQVTEEVSPRSTTERPPVETTEDDEGSSPRKNKKHKGRGMNGWVFAIIVASIIMVSAAVVVGFYYQRNRQLHRDQIFHQSQLADGANIYGDTVHLQPDIDKDQREGRLADNAGWEDTTDDAADISTIRPSNGARDRVMDNI